jgi:xanthine dehydrogenase accessory factor
MVDMRDVLDELTAVLERGQACVACVVVETRGSTPQKAGAAMLVFPDGGQFGTLGGGCIEAEVRQRSLRVLGEPSAKPELLTFTLDDDYGWDDGLICGGRMTVLAHPLAADCAAEVRSYFRGYRDLIEQGRGCVEAICLDQSSNLGAGNRYLFAADGTLIGSIANGGPTDELVQHLPDLSSRPRPSVHRGIAYLPVPERVRLLIVGCGHVGQAVAELASRVGFDLWVLDDREHYANPERFPSAQRILVGDIGQVLKKLIEDGDITPATYCLIVTRGHNHDEEALYHLAKTGAGYVGMIGSKRKIKLIFEDLIIRGISEETLERVHAPLGLPIGSQTVPEIAVSIVAELIQCRNLPNVPAKVTSCSTR